MYATPSSSPICFTVFFVSRYCFTEVRDVTCNSRIRDNWDRISSCTPSVKNSFSFSVLRFSNGSTAMDLGPFHGGREAGFSFPGGRNATNATSAATPNAANAQAGNRRAVVFGANPAPARPIPGAARAAPAPTPTSGP